MTPATCCGCGWGFGNVGILTAIWQWILKMLGIKKEADDVPQGLQVFDASGNIVLDITDRLTRVLGEVNTGAAAGSVTDAGLSSGDPWYIAFRVDGAMWSSADADLAISISGTTLSWSYGSGTAQNMTITYGVY